MTRKRAPKRPAKNQSLIRGKLAPSMLALSAFTIFKTGQYIEQKFSEMFTHQPLKVRHFAVLRVLVHDEATTQQELSEALWIDRATMTALVKDLLASGLVKRTFHEQDGRSFILSPTAAGHKYYQRLDTTFTRLGEEIFPALTAAELERVQQILRKALMSVTPGC